MEGRERNLQWKATIGCVLELQSSDRWQLGGNLSRLNLLL